VKFATDIKPISHVKANAAEIIETIQETGRPVVITQHGEAKAVLIDSVSYHAMTETIALLKIVNQSERDFNSGRFKEQSKVFSDLRKKYKINQ